MAAEHPTTSRGRSTAILVTMLAAALLSWFPASPARADDQPSQQAAVLCEQAIALITNGAGDARVADQLHEALAAPDRRGVTLALVARAHTLIDHHRPSQDLAVTAQAKALLLASMGGRLPSSPRGQATGAQTGTRAVLPPFGHARGVTDGGDAALLGLSLAAIAAGLYLARRLRPPHTLRQLTHPAGSGKETPAP